MATLSFQLSGMAIVSSLAGPVGPSVFALAMAGGVGAAAGAYVDQQFLFPTLFPPDDVKGPRLDDHPIMTAREGSPILKCYGPGCRVPGTVIWMSELIETKREEEGGKGGGSEKVIHYTYAAHVAVAFCAGPVNKVTRIYADGQDIFKLDRAPDDIVSDKIRAEMKDHGPGPYGYRYSALVTDIPEPGLGRFVPAGQDHKLSVSGFVDGRWNVERKVLESGTSDDGLTTYVILPRTDDLPSEAAGATVTLSQTMDDEQSGIMDSLTIYKGTEGQTADATIATYEDDVPAFRGLCYAVFENLQLMDFGNRIPQFTAEIEEAATKTVGETIDDILADASLDSTQYDTSALTGTMRGYVIRGPLATTSALQPLQVAFDVVAQETDDELVFLERSDVDSVTIDADELAAHQSGSDSQAHPVGVDDLSQFRMPAEVSVTHVDLNNDYQTGEQKAKRAFPPELPDVALMTKETVHVDMPVTLTASEARCIAERLLWTAWANRRHFSLALSHTRLAIQENDRLSVPAFEETYTLLVSRVERGMDGVIQVEAVEETSIALSYTGCPSEEKEGADSDYNAPTIDEWFMECPALDTEQLDVMGFYHSVTTTTPEQKWKGAAFWQRRGQAGGWSELEPYRTRGRFGFAETALAGMAYEVPYWDRENTVDVTLLVGSLSTTDEGNVLKGINRMMLGPELIGFATVTVLDTRRYRLSNLLRGLRGTWAASNDHAVNEYAVHLNGGGIRFKAISEWSVGNRYQYKAIPVGEQFDNADSIVMGPLEGTNLRPFSPVHVTAIRDTATEDVRTTWVRRTRGFVDPFLSDDPARYEEPHYFQVRVWSAVDATTASRTVGTSDTTWVYKKAAQIEDGLDGDAFWFNVRQLSQKVGWGQASPRISVAAP